jgi:hypothetical protein
MGYIEAQWQKKQILEPFHPESTKGSNVLKFANV